MTGKEILDKIAYRVYEIRTKDPENNRERRCRIMLKKLQLF